MGFRNKIRVFENSIYFSYIQFALKEIENDGKTHNQFENYIYCGFIKKINSISLRLMKFSWRVNFGKKSFRFFKLFWTSQFTTAIKVKEISSLCLDCFQNIYHLNFKIWKKKYKNFCRKSISSLNHAFLIHEDITILFYFRIIIDDCKPVEKKTFDSDR